MTQGDTLVYALRSAPPSPMPPKADPYCNRAQAAIDVILVCITALVMFVVFYTSSKSHHPLPASDSPSLQTSKVTGK